MRIAFLTQPWATAVPPSESVAIWTKEVAQRLAGDHDVRVWSRGPAGAPPLLLDGVEYRFVRGRGDYRLERALRRFDRLRPAARPVFASPAYQASYHLELLRALRADPPDVIHVQTFSQLVRPAKLACRGAAVVLHIRDQMTAGLAPGLLRRRLTRADAVIGCSEFVAAGLRAACGDAAPRVRAILNGVDVGRFTTSERPSSGPVRLLYVGRISPEKGTHVLFEAFAKLSADHELKLDVVGEEAVPPADMVALLGGPEVRSHAAPGYLARSLKPLPESVRARVRLHGKRSHDELPSFYAQADVVVVPSLSEAFGTAAVEGMASGLPVVGTSAGGIPEVVADEETGLLAAPGDPAALAGAISRLVADPELRGRLGAAGRRRAEERFSYERIAGEIAQLYAGLGRSQ
jgi:glycosyltransferase involved in cell wall biosynthesis